MIIRACLYYIVFVCLFWCVGSCNTVWWCNCYYTMEITGTAMLLYALDKHTQKWIECVLCKIALGVCIVRLFLMAFDFLDYEPVGGWDRYTFGGAMSVILVTLSAFVTDYANRTVRMTLVL